MVPKRAAASERQNTQGQNEQAKHRREETEKSTSKPTMRANGNEPRELATPILISKATGQTFDRIRTARAIVALRKARSPLKPISIAKGMMRQEVAMKVSEAMTRDVCVASPDETIRQAAKTMASLDAGVLPVGENDHLIGMISDRDIAIRGIAQGKGPKAKVRDVMTEDVKYCFDDQDVEEVTRNMADIQVRRLPVLNRDKRLVGILSLGDIAISPDSKDAGEALRGISRPGGEHTQAG